MKPLRGEIIEVAVDWITATASIPSTEEVVQALAFALLSEERDAGNDTSPWYFRGYEGFRCGQVQIGTRPGSTCVRLSGAQAARNWRELYVTSDGCSRCDLQVTVRTELDASKVIGMVHRGALRYSKKRKGVPTVTIVRSTDGSATVYIGKRTSDLFGRIYLKGAESKLDHYAGTVRFEVELKGPACLQALRAVSVARPELITIAGYVQGFFSARGVELALPSVDSRHISVRRQMPDNARRLVWLRDQVRPSVQLLISAGCYTEVLDALGLSE